MFFLSLIISFLFHIEMSSYDIYSLKRLRFYSKYSQIEDGVNDDGYDIYSLFRETFSNFCSICINLFFVFWATVYVSIPFGLRVVQFYWMIYI